MPASRFELGHAPANRADATSRLAVRLKWSCQPWRASFQSLFISGVQRLPNGNTLVCSGAPGRVFEVTPDGQVVWDWKSPFTAEEGEEGDELKRYPTAVFRVLRYAPDHPGIAALRAKGADIPLDVGHGPPTVKGHHPSRT
jgi:hypothetical protein